MSSTYTRSSRQQTLELLASYQKKPSVRLRSRLVQLNIGLVRKEAHRRCRQSQTELFDDLIQVGSIGLLKAIERFELTRGCAFSSFAIPYIRGEISHYLRDKEATVRVPRRFQDLLRQSEAIAVRLRTELKRAPSDREVAIELGVPLSEWQQARQSAANRRPISLDAPLQGEANRSALSDLLPDAYSQRVQTMQEDRSQLQSAISRLEAKNREAIEAVFIRDLTHKEAANLCSIGQRTLQARLNRGIVQLRILMREV